VKRLVALAFLCGCARQDDAKIAPVHEITDAAPPERLPEVRTKTDIDANDHKRVVMLGTYDVEPVRLHKKGGRMTTIVLADGTHVYRAYGPVKSELAFVSHKVRVTGIITKGPPDPMMQSVGGPHVDLESLRLEDGETLNVPAQIPTPPLVTTMAGFARYEGRWVAVNAKLDAVLSSAGPWGSAIVMLSDGSLVDADSILTVEWTPLVSKEITTIGRVDFEGTDAAIGMRVSLLGAGAPCPGYVPRCRMDEPED